MFFGFAKIDIKQAGCPIGAQLLAAYTEQFPSDPPTDYWPASTYCEHPYRYWRQETFEAIRSGQFAKDLKPKLEILVKIAKKVCPDEGIIVKR